MILHLDFETRSLADLPSVGAHRYACDPSTEVLMAAYSYDDSEDVKLWINPEFGAENLFIGDLPPILDLRATIYCHNAPFEQAMTNGCLRRNVELHQWRCTAAMARKAGLPSSLEKCAEALGLAQQKDSRGKKLIKFFSIPKPDGTFNEPRDFPEEFKEFGEYCKQDVRTEKAIHKKLKAFELTGFALETFQFDLRMNQRGIPVNVPALKNAQKIIESVQKDVTAEFQQLTGLNPTQRAKVLEWINGTGLRLENMQAETVQAAIDGVSCNPNPMALLALTMYQKLSFAAVKKVDTMLDWVCPDGRMRGTFTFYGAGTGRWSARGPQPHNGKKPTAEMRPFIHQAYAGICDGWSAGDIEAVYGPAFEVLSSCIRHFIGDPSAEMLDGDYNAIEARIACWLSRQDDAVKEYREGVDRYRLMAAEIYQKPMGAVTADEREVGKRAVLGLGYAMGAEKFKDSCEIMYGVIISLELAERAKMAFRRKHSKMQAYWYFLDNAAREAIRFPGRESGPFIVRTVAGMPYLLGKLPSGRSIAYPKPLIEFQDGWQGDQITYWGQLPLSTQWGRIKLYGGKLFENFCQGIAADVMAHGAIEAEKQGMPIFALIHDQGLAERLNGKTADDFSNALATLPPWAKGLPLKVESKVCKYYSK